MSLPLVVSPNVLVPAEAMHVTAVRASGPGGQNVNKVSSKVELRVDPRDIQGLPMDALGRLRSLARGRLDAEGRIVITSQATRDRGRNLEDARDKLRGLVAAALVVPKTRRATRPSRGARERRLSDKRKTSERKQSRRGED
jgi:ribosome-associated protein